MLLRCFKKHGIMVIVKAGIYEIERQISLVKSKGREIVAILNSCKVERLVVDEALPYHARVDTNLIPRPKVDSKSNQMC